MMRKFLLPVALLGALAACGSEPQSQTYKSEAEGVIMTIVVSEGVAKVDTVEYGETVGKHRRGVLVEIEVATNTRCRAVSLAGQTEETENATTRATLTYLLDGCI